MANLWLHPGREQCSCLCGAAKDQGPHAGCLPVELSSNNMSSSLVCRLSLGYVKLRNISVAGSCAPVSGVGVQRLDSERNISVARSCAATGLCLVQGAYRDDSGRPVVLESVREAERRVAGSHFMEYLPIGGGYAYGKHTSDRTWYITEDVLHPK